MPHSARQARQDLASSGRKSSRIIDRTSAGLLAVQIASGSKGKQADSAGALHAVAGQDGGIVVLWLLAAGFAGLALWRLAEAGHGQAGPGGHKAGRRLVSLGLAALYGFVSAGIVAFILGTGSRSSGDARSQDLTAKVMAHPGGRWLVIGIGIGLVATGAGLAAYGLRKQFTGVLDTAQMNARTRKAVEFLGMAGNVARGVVFGVAGVLSDCRGHFRPEGGTRPRWVAAQDRNDTAGPVAARRCRPGTCDLWGLLLL